MSSNTAAQDDLLFSEEHTYGAAESIRDPMAENAQVQWGEKAACAWSFAYTIPINASNLLLVEARPARNRNGIFLDLRELDGIPTTLTAENVISWSELQQADEVNVLEETLREGIESLPFRPYEAKFVRLMFR